LEIETDARTRAK